MRKTSLLIRLFLMPVLMIGMMLSLVACSSWDAPPRGRLNIVLKNMGDDSVEDFSVEHAGQEVGAAYLAPGTEQTSSIFLDPDFPLVVEYRHGNRQYSESYPIRALREHSGTIELRVERNGELRPVERFFVR